MKTCSRCKIEKPLSDFHKRSARPSGVMSECKPCRVEKEKSRYAQKREYVIERQRAYNHANREKINIRQSVYNAKNKEKIQDWQKNNREKINKYLRERRANDPLFRLSDNVRRRTLYAIKNGGYRKNTRTTEILGCCWETLKTHLESKFKDGMTWQNLGEWEIDHIVPYASAKTEQDILRLSHYTNLQPLWRSENRSKSGKY